LSGSAVKSCRAAGAAVAVLIVSAHLAAQTSSPPDPRLAEILQRPLPLRSGIGRAHEPVTTASKDAQAFYDQGLAYLHAFFWIEAARSFSAALRLDAGVALAHVGLSYALAELGDGAGARAAAARAEGLAQGVSDRERVRIDLRVRQLRAAVEPADAAAVAAYRALRDAAVARFPDDVELLLAAGRAQDPSHDAHGMRSGSAALTFYERALAQSPDYFATHHYLTHALENVDRAERALDHAAAFARLAPAIPHAHHMHGHVLRRVGRMREAIEAFQRAEALGAAYLTGERIPAELDWHYRHNLDLLGTSFQYLGQLRAAEPVLRRAFEMPATPRLNDELNRREWPNFLLARGRTKDALAAAATLAQHPLSLVRALGEILRSRSLSALRRAEEAAAAGNSALRQMRAAGPSGGLLVPDFQLAQGEHLLRSGQADAARTQLREAAAKLRQQSGPDAWVQTLFALEGIARVAREQGDWTLAAEIGDAMRQHDAAYPGTAYALALVAEHRGQRAQARAGFRAAAQGWANADADVAEAIDARKRAAAP
jgi:tetratricopeptide (TPR) repeat protein